MVSDIKEININEIDKSIDLEYVIDIREKDEYSDERIDRVKNITYSEIVNNPEEYLEEGKKYYLMCRSGRRSFIACEVLKNLGYDVINLKGGICAYNGEKTFGN